MKSTIVLTGAIAALVLIGCTNPASSGITLPDTLDSASKAAIPQTAAFISETGSKIVAEAATLEKDDTVSLSIEGTSATGTVTSITAGASATANGSSIAPAFLAATTSTVRYTVGLSFSDGVTGDCTVTVYEDNTWSIDGALTFNVQDDQGTDQTATVDFDQTTISGEGEITSGTVKVNDTAIDNGYGTAMTQFAKFAAALTARLAEDGKSIADYLQLDHIDLRLSTKTGYSFAEQYDNSDDYNAALTDERNKATQSLGSSGGDISASHIDYYNVVHEGNKYNLDYQYDSKEEGTLKVINGEIDYEKSDGTYTYIIGGSGTVYDVDTIGDITVAVDLTGEYDENNTRYWNGSITVNGVKISISTMALANIESLIGG